MMNSGIRNPSWECRKRLRLLARKLLADRRGVAAIEFAMLVPIMLVMFFGTIEFSVGVAANRKVSLMAQTLSDLTSRSISVSDTDLQQLLCRRHGDHDAVRRADL